MRDDLKKARLDVGLTQTELADKIGTTQDVVSRYESGKRIIDQETALLIAEALRLPVLSVLYGTRNVEPKESVNQQ